MSGLHHHRMERGALMPGHHIEASYWRIRQFGRCQFKLVSWFLRVSEKKTCVSGKKHAQQCSCKPHTFSLETRKMRTGLHG
jgi:hypothetical protein